MRVLNTLYVTEHRARVGLQKGNLVVALDGERKRVPIETIEAVTMLGGGQISAQALSRCVERAIRVSALRRNGRLRWVVGGPTKGNVLLRVAQVSASCDPTKLVPIARAIVAGKLENCRRLMERWAEEATGPERSMMLGEREAVADRLASLTTAVDGDLIRGIEGDGTRRYFKCLRAHLAGRDCRLGFEGRSRRPPRDEMNALLSFLYGLVLTEVVGALDSVGLDPQVGFLHGLRPGRESLALDLLEEFRPSLADRLAVRTATRRVIRPEHFFRVPGGACYLTDDGREAVLREYERFKSEMVMHRLLDRGVPRWSLPSLQATLMARHLRGDIPAYPPYVVVGARTPAFAER